MAGRAQLRIGLVWLAQSAVQAGQVGLIVVPTVGQFSSGALRECLEIQAARPSLPRPVRMGSAEIQSDRSTPLTRWELQVGLAAPSCFCRRGPKRLQRVVDDHQVGDLCVVPWTYNDIRAWADGTRATDLGDTGKILGRGRQRPRPVAHRRAREPNHSSEPQHWPRPSLGPSCPRSRCLDFSRRRRGGNPCPSKRGRSAIKSAGPPRCGPTPRSRPGSTGRPPLWDGPPRMNRHHQSVAASRCQARQVACTLLRRLHPPTRGVGVHGR